ncbi:A disintegrin and metalloproteinase with thrombospondin motifs 9 isoform X1 [Megalopta genalis]|uniref:A disintegrin and metalloproteinase with thrombospondin motifs 9 isoform X1 n=1 Tax=Megalopta genalis TaxID=115081 RepID=UPI003FD05439
MHPAVRGDADMSRISNCASTVAAAVSIVLLVIFLVILWAGVRAPNNVQTVHVVKQTDGSPDSEVQPFGGASEKGFVDETTTAVNDATSNTTATIVTANNRIIFDEISFSNEVIPEKGGASKQQNKSSIETMSSPKADLEYVRLMKISENQYEDPPDPYSTARRHHSGHFRLATAEVWDPHPQYEFTAFGRRFRLRLAHDSSFISPNIKITHMSANTSRREHPGHELGCFYSGVVDGDPSSCVTVSLCHGMTGHVRTSTGSYMINPAEPWRGNDKDSREFSLQHAIQRDANHLYGADDSSNSNNCGVIDDDIPNFDTDDVSENKVYIDTLSRRRRSLTEKKFVDDVQNKERYESPVERRRSESMHFLRNSDRYKRHYFVEHRRDEISVEYGHISQMELTPFMTHRALPLQYFIEIMVVADAKMIDYHHREYLTGYILLLMSTVSRIYKDQSIGNAISISVMKIVQTDHEFAPRDPAMNGSSAADMLKNFCEWQKYNNPDEPSPVHHDAALLLTRENLCHDPMEVRCDILGLAEVGRMCSRKSSCAIVQDTGLAASFTIAHEIGHVLSMPHDDDKKCEKFRNSSGLHNIMSRVLDNNTFPWKWSKCSRHFVTDFLESYEGTCLLDKPDQVENIDMSRLPGENYTADQQCELAFGEGSHVCTKMVSHVCRRLWCTAPKWGHYNQCHTEYMPWADGTDCGGGKWCIRGECVVRSILEPVNGQWGEWGSYGECSRTCGGGVQKKYRECNNPPPQNYGNYCVGARVKYRSCNLEDCPSGSPGVREMQCAYFNNNNMNIPDLPENVTWSAKYNRILPHERCKLYCEVESNQYYSLQEKVLDGTPCGMDTFHICVNGYCRPAGCDRVLNSDAKLDTCGVCKGDNSTCQRITGSYNSTRQGYVRVTTIPAGSRYIDIRQHSFLKTQYDQNYLALRLGEGGEHILNGKYMMTARVIGDERYGVAVDYNGYDSVVERLNSSKPIGTDLILEVLCVSGQPPQITYEYTISKKILHSYIWILSNWSQCSRLCEGMQYRKAECKSTEHKDVVPNGYCREEERPREDSQTCNNHCHLKWRTSVSECSSHCGSGVRTVTSRCIQSFRNSEYPPRSVPMQACAHLSRPDEDKNCTGPCDNVEWLYGEWSNCDVTCGVGVQHRTATCVDSNGRPVPENNCPRHEKPLKKTCELSACPTWEFEQWSPCAAICGTGKRQKRYLCRMDGHVVSDNFCGDSPPKVVEMCNTGPCEQWQTDSWNSCSVTCGKGTRSRKVTCKTPSGTISTKCSPSNKPKEIVTCVLKPCATIMNPIKYSPDPPNGEFSQDNEVGDIVFHSGYKWKVESPKKCSKPCNNGYMHRDVKCIAIETENTAPDNYCDKSRKPFRSIPCNRHECPMWNTGAWGHCNAECGNGFQYRQVSCQHPNGKPLLDEKCHDSEKPLIVRPCRKHPCKTDNNRRHRMEMNIFRKWKVSNWTACSKSCGSGLQRRRVECTMRRGNHGPEVTVKDEQCSRLGLTKPRSQRPCRRTACDYIWQEGTWSECSADCGEGIQHRTVTCHRTNRYGLTDPTYSDNCPPDQKPHSQQVCKLRECSDKYYWFAGPWKTCSHTCGPKGRQTRRLYCFNARTHKRVVRTNCPIEFKPPRKQRCNQIKCYPMSCLEAKKYYRNSTDNEYNLFVNGRWMNIYCHDMTTNEPKEYLTLQAGFRENYVEIYHKRLIDHQSCLYNGYGNGSCNCATGREVIFSRTMFRRVRIDLIKLHILENDYTFSRSEGKDRIKYGMVSDCYNRAYCFQGRFSINLSGTQLKLSSDVTWKSSTPGISVEINNISSQHINGKCEGHCGFCNPKFGLKLDVLPP